MKKTLFVCGAIAFLACMIVTAGRISNAADADEGANIDAVMRLDVTPLVEHMEKMQAELAEMKKLVAKLQEAMGQMPELIGELNDRIESMRKPALWQYYYVKSRSVQAANRLGEQGWELVAATDDWFLFKKPLGEEKREEELLR